MRMPSEWTLYTYAGWWDPRNWVWPVFEKLENEVAFRCWFFVIRRQWLY